MVGVPESHIVPLIPGDLPAPYGPLAQVVLEDDSAVLAYVPLVLELLPLHNARP